jgi:membrane-associated phospholipid phosphatase
MKLKYFLLLGFFIHSSAFAQQDSTDAAQENETEEAYVEESAPHGHRHRGGMYNINYAYTLPVVGVGGAWCGYAFSKIYSKSETPTDVILALDKNNVPAFDRWVAGKHNDDLDKFSYYPFYAVMPLPLILLADKHISKNAGTVGLLYLESFAYTGVLYTASVYFVDRFRPDVYNTSLELGYRKNGNFRNSFFAGHVAVVAGSTFFIAKVYSDYHPHSPWNWVFYGASIASTAAMAYMRLEAGKHFPSDILIGAAIGTAAGILTPELHKVMRGRPWHLQPEMYPAPGLSFSYHFQ